MMQPDLIFNLTYSLFIKVRNLTGKLFKLLINFYKILLLDKLYSIVQQNINSIDKMGLKSILLVVLSLILICLTSPIQQLTKQSSNEVFGAEFKEFISQQGLHHKQYLILFYLPEVQRSLDARTLIYEIDQEYQRVMIQKLKKKGITQFQQFQREMKNALQLVDIDCGYNQDICQYFNIIEYPSLIYMAKNKKTYSYLGWVNSQEILGFLLRPQTHRLQSRLIKQHSTQSSIILTIQSFFKNQIVLFCLLFLIMPFAFGYFFSTKKDASGTDKEDKVKNIQKSDANKKQQISNSKDKVKKNN